MSDLLLSLGGVVQARCSEDKEDLLPILLVAILEMQPALELRHSGRGGEVLLEKDLASLLGPLQGADLRGCSMRRFQVLREVFLFEEDKGRTRQGEGGVMRERGRSEEGIIM